MTQTRARILKIAFQTEDITDCLAAFHLLERARSKNREMIAIAMGTAGVMTRVLGPSRGAFLSMARWKIKGNRPVQITARELRTRIALTAHSRTRIMALPCPVTHSISPYIIFAFESAHLMALPSVRGREISSFLKRLFNLALGDRLISWAGGDGAAHSSVRVVELIDPAAKEYERSIPCCSRRRAARLHTDACLISPIIPRMVKTRGALCSDGGGRPHAPCELRQKVADVTSLPRCSSGGTLLSDWRDVETLGRRRRGV